MLVSLAKLKLWIVDINTRVGPIGESFWQKESLLQYTMTLLQSPKDPVLPTLMDMPIKDSENYQV